MAEPEEISLVEEIQRLAQSDPFEPFSIVMASGERYEVDVTTALAFTRNVVAIFAYQRGWAMLRQAQISEVVVPEGVP